jgi:hypothetical protein
VTRGNALYLRELVLQGLEQGQLSAAGGVWRWHGPLAPGARLSELIEGRLGRLAEMERELIELLAVGEPLGASELESLTAASTLEELERRGLSRSSATSVGSRPGWHIRSTARCCAAAPSRRG